MVLDKALTVGEMGAICVRCRCVKLFASNAIDIANFGSSPATAGLSENCRWKLLASPA
jgi:hypothetical protein